MKRSGPARRARLAIALLGGLTLSPLWAAPAVRVKDLADIEGVRGNQLIGYGLVVGLQGTGDGTQAAFTIQSIAQLLRETGVLVPASAVRVRNVAAVLVTAELPPFVRNGQRLDVQVASLGDAKSLQGGTLVMTPPRDAPDITRAGAQGSVSIGGAFLGGGGGNAVQKNHPTAGRVPGGAIVEKASPTPTLARESFRLLLQQPDMQTARRLADAINERFGERSAHAEDSVGVRIQPPAALADDPVTFLSEIQSLEIRPDVVARVAINEKTGTVVMGQEVRISKVALAHGNLTIEVETRLEASQPLPFSDGGETTVLEQTAVFAQEEPNTVLTLEEGISVGQLVEALNELGVSSRDMIAIFQAMREAGALHAELVLL